VTIPLDPRIVGAHAALVVEDDRHIRELLCHHLEAAGYECTAVADGALALKAAQDRTFSLIVLDLMLPGIDGLTICRTIRQGGVNRDAPILMLTARHEELDKVQGLNSGADDYLTKPFSLPELVARAHALTRRARAPVVDVDAGWQRPLSVHGLELDPARRTVIVRGHQVPVTRQEFTLLYFFATHPGIVFRRDRLLARVWQEQAFVTERSVDALVKRVRRKIESNSDKPELILTVWGDGYKFADV
jgi:two-component system OmpR family response regulator